MLTPIETLGETLLALLSLIPGLSLLSSLFSLRRMTNVVLRLELIPSGLKECTTISDEKEQRTQHSTEELLSKQTERKEEEEEEEEEEGWSLSSSVEYLRRLRSISVDLSGSLPRLRSVSSLSSLDIPSLHFPLPLFGKVRLVSLLSIIEERNV